MKILPSTLEIRENIDNNDLDKFKKIFDKQTAAFIYATRNPKDFKSIIEFALKNKNKDFFEAAYQAASNNIDNSYKEFLLINAIRNGTPTSNIGLLIDKVKPEITEETIKNALAEAAFHGRKEVVEIIFNKFEKQISIDTMRNALDYAKNKAEIISSIEKKLNEAVTKVFAELLPLVRSTTPKTEDIGKGIEILGPKLIKEYKENLLIEAAKYGKNETVAYLLGKFEGQISTESMEKVLEKSKERVSEQEANKIGITLQKAIFAKNTNQKLAELEEAWKKRGTTEKVKISPQKQYTEKFYDFIAKNEVESIARTLADALKKSPQQNHGNGKKNNIMKLAILHEAPIEIQLKLREIENKCAEIEGKNSMEPKGVFDRLARALSSVIDKFKSRADKSEMKDALLNLEEITNKFEQKNSITLNTLTNKDLENLLTNTKENIENKKHSHVEKLGKDESTNKTKSFVDLVRTPQSTSRESGFVKG